MMKRILIALVLSTGLAHAQSVTQSGTVTAGHVPRWVSSGVIGDGGTAADSPITTLGVTNNGAAGFCVSSARQTASGRNQLCFGAITNGGTRISSYTYGTATNPGIEFDINGSLQGFPAVTLPVVNDHAACFDGTTGLLKDCGAAPLPATLQQNYVFVGNASNIATGVPVTGDASIVSSGAWTNLKVNGVAYPSGPSVGTIPVVTSSNQITYQATLPAGAFANPTASVGLTTVNGVATTAMRSDAAPPLSASVQSALTGTNHGVLLGTGAFGFNSTAAPGTGNCFVSKDGSTDPSFQPCRVYITAFGASTGASAATNDAAIAAAIAALPASGGEVFVPRATTAGQCYSISATVTLGDGTNTTQSTRQHIKLVGEGIGTGAGFTNVQINGPSCLQWNGAAGGTMLQIAGPSIGSGVWGLSLDANDLAATCIEQIHNSNGNFNFSCRRYTGTALTLNARSTLPVGVAYGNCTNYYHEIVLAGPSTSAGNGVSLDGNVTSGADSCSNVFMGGTIIYGGAAGTYGVKYVFADNNTFVRTIVTAFGGSSGNSFLFEKAAAPQDGFPKENTHYSIAANYACGGTSGTRGQNQFIGTTADDGFSCTIGGTSSIRADNGWVFENTQPLTAVNADASATWLNMRNTVGGVLLGSIYRTSNDLAIQSWTGGGNLLLNPASGNVQVGAVGNVGVLKLLGSSSGNVTQTVPAAAGTPTVTWGSSSGTPAVTASSPLAINTSTGNITCSTCATTAGANIPALATGDILYASATNTLSALADVATGNALISGGGGGVAPAWGKIGISTHVSGLGTGVATALGVNVGTAGAFVVNGGALGSPSSAGTIPAFTLGGTISGGGNQINNVVIGTSTPLAGSFTTLAASTSTTTPLVIGGTSAGSDLTFQTTTGSGSGDDFIWNAGNNGATERMRLTSTGLGIGANAPATQFVVNGNTSQPPTPTSGAMAQFVGATSATARLSIDGIANNANITGRRTNTSIGSPSNVLSGNPLMAIAAQGYKATTYSGTQAALTFRATEDWTDSATGTDFIFQTTAAGGTTLATRMTVNTGIVVGTGTGSPGSGVLQLTAQTFGSLTACSSGMEGATASVTDSSTATWRATITGGGANHVLAYCNGTNWTVAG